MPLGLNVVDKYSRIFVPCLGPCGVLGLRKPKSLVSLGQLEGGHNGNRLDSCIAQETESTM